MLVKFQFNRFGVSKVPTAYGPEGDASGGEGQGGDSGAGAGSGGNQGGNAGGASGNAGAGANKSFTQADVDRILNQRFKKEREEREQMLARFKEIETNGLTPDAREAFETQIQTLQESLQTKEQVSQNRLTEVENKYKKQITGVTTERDTWKTRFERSTIERAIMDAASVNQAEDPSQLIMMFGGSTVLEEQLDEKGVPTGNFAAMLKFRGVDAESKKPVDLKLPVSEAVAHMREYGLHKNLFKHGSNQGTGKSGTGAGGGTGSAEPKPEDFSSPAAYSAAYQSWRDTHDANGNPLKK